MALAKSRKYLAVLKDQIMASPKLRAVLDKVPADKRDLVIAETYDRILEEKTANLIRENWKLYWDGIKARPIEAPLRDVYKRPL